MMFYTIDGGNRVLVFADLSTMAVFLGLALVSRGRGRLRAEPSQASRSITPSYLSKDQVNHPAAAHVLPRLAAVTQDVFVVTVGVLIDPCPSPYTDSRSFPDRPLPGARLRPQRPESTPSDERLQRFPPPVRPGTAFRQPQDPLIHALLPLPSFVIPTQSAPALGRRPSRPLFRQQLSSTRGISLPQPADPAQDLREQLPRHGHFGQLEDHVLRMMDHLGPDLDELLPQRRQRPALDRPRQD
jgi:hypothetical protein